MTLSGRFLLRLPAALHSELKAHAEREELSLNEFCVRRLSMPAVPMESDPDARELVRRADAMFGSQLVGILLYGSWVRGEATDQSDVDALVVLDPSVELTRALYREWDAHRLAWGGRALDVHFAHLPGEMEVTGGAWAEAAIDGRVLFEHAGRVSAQLTRVRRAIVDGRLVRRMVHGQSYWRTSVSPPAQTSSSASC